MNFLKGALKAANGEALSVETAGSTVAVTGRSKSGRAGEAVTFGIRPEHITLGQGQTRLADVRVDLIEQLGDQTMIYATTADGQGLTIALEGQQRFDNGTTVTAFIDPARAHVFAENGNVI
jgi:multiple sugar transport system ATP-binding protein